MLINCPENCKNHTKNGVKQTNEGAAFQDKEYGKNKRVANPRVKVTGNTCTVCGVTIASASSS